VSHVLGQTKSVKMSKMITYIHLFKLYRTEKEISISEDKNVMQSECRGNRAVITLEGPLGSPQ